MADSNLEFKILIGGVNTAEPAFAQARKPVESLNTVVSGAAVGAGKGGMLGTLTVRRRMRCSVGPLWPTLHFEAFSAFYVGHGGPTLLLRRTAKRAIRPRLGTVPIREDSRGRWCNLCAFPIVGRIRATWQHDLPRRPADARR